MNATEGYAPEVETELWDDELDPGLEGEVLAGRYKILRRLGQGGMATVYVAEHVDIGRRCAVKVLAPAYAGDPEAVERFLREARATSKIRHPSVIEITDFGRAGGTVFFVMELLEGEDLLTRIVRTKRIAWPEAKEIVLQICDALRAAHEHGIIHRDLKPDNCFCVDRPGGVLVKVLDFGIAKVNAGSLRGQALTQLGRVFGTPAYMSPEQADGQTVDLRTDIYSLGVTMYYMLTGQVPFMADSPMGFMKQHLFSVPRSPRAVAPEAEIPVEVEAIVLKALQKDPALRFQDMAEVIAAIHAVGTGRGPVTVVAEALAVPASFLGRAMGFQAEQGASRSRRLAIVGAAALALVVIVGFLVFGGEEPADVPPPVVAEAVPPPPEPPKQPEPPPTVHLHFRGDVAAEVRDPVSGAVLGRTSDPAGIVVPRSAERRELVLVAEGYEDERIPLTPDADQTFSVTMRRKKKTGPGGKKTGKKGNGPSLEPLDPFGGKKKPR